MAQSEGCERVSPYPRPDRDLHLREDSLLTLIAPSRVFEMECVKDQQGTRQADSNGVPLADSEQKWFAALQRLTASYEWPSEVEHSS